MAKKVIIENGFKTRYAVIYDERLDSKSGKQYMKQKLFPTSEEADKFLEDIGNDKSELRILLAKEQKKQQATKILFNEYVEDWFYGEYAHVIKYQTFKVRQALLNKHIVPHLGDKYLHEITGQKIVELLAQKDREGYSKSTVGSVHNFLSTLFRSAVKKGYLDKNPIRFMNMVKAPNRIPVILSESEIEKFLEATYSEGEGMMYEFGLSTGLRLAEILALSWSDLDFDHQTIIVKKIVDAGIGGKQNIVEIRSNFRQVMIPSHLLPKLQKHKEEQQLIKEELGDRYGDALGLVFPKKGGGVQSPSTVRARFNRLVDKANISKINFHDLRKTHASLLVKAGVPLYLVSKQLGYKSVDTLYHFLPPQFSDSMKSIKLFGVNDKENDID
ncbi:site-specific integrase [Bacillus sp. S/N-304-OC-R1]|uniref:tyrosine-type recombinase/integrase n=1 Tax=Bacillus sp. S/N-304-OC-R1 TaxID=2758034 RepID=UPI001C8D7D99|nr:site-specific integrase [Bacillus sp. S/N-304-OC-R1]MBY0124411.1 tyrosine-type recombinase/integrase [Bacillus sp. S/N-304-OC-R1]